MVAGERPFGRQLRAGRDQASQECPALGQVGAQAPARIPHLSGVQQQYGLAHLQLGHARHEP